MSSGYERKDSTKRPAEPNGFLMGLFNEDNDIRWKSCQLLLGRFQVHILCLTFDVGGLQLYN